MARLRSRSRFSRERGHRTARSDYVGDIGEAFRAQQRLGSIHRRCRKCLENGLAGSWWFPAALRRRAISGCQGRLRRQRLTCWPGNAARLYALHQSLPLYSGQHTQGRLPDPGCPPSRQFPHFRSVQCRSPSHPITSVAHSARGQKARKSCSFGPDHKGYPRAALTAARLPVAAVRKAATLAVMPLVEAPPCVLEPSFLP